MCSCRRPRSTADIGFIVTQGYRVGNGTLIVIQSPSPALTMPEGVDLPRMGEALLRVLGMSDADARRLAQQIDWTSTLIIPLPTNLVQFREVQVDGSTGLVLEQTGQDTGEPDRFVIWERGGIVYAVSGHNVSVDELLQTADSMK